MFYLHEYMSVGHYGKKNNPLNSDTEQQQQQLIL
jgi:hypothetical protein